MVKLRKIDEIHMRERPPLRELLDKVAEILREGGVREVVRERGGEIVDGLNLLHSLRALGVEKIPVARTGEGVREIFFSLEELGFYEEVKGNPLKVYSSSLELLVHGWPTPLVRLNSLSRKGLNVWAKLECFNPFSNSIKDRVGWAMVREAELRGRLGRVLYEATSTNTGIALAAIAAIKGLRARLYLPMKVQRVSDIYLKVLGAEVIRLPVSLTVDVIEDVDREAIEDGATHLNQFENDANFMVHLRYTAKELDYQLREGGIKPRIIMGGVGTSGHMSAIAFYFKNRMRGEVRIVGVQPKEGETIPGIRRIESGMKWIHWVSFDKIVDVGFEEAVEEVLRVARRDGILIGLSSGAVVHGFRMLEPMEGDAVLIFPDSGYKYFEQFERYFSQRQAT